jgi:hypothetical protein
MALRLGELLMNEKLFTRAQLEEALQAQAVFGGRLGTILIEMGAIGELDLARVLSKQMGVPFVSPDQLVDIPRAALDALTPELAMKFQCLPIHVEGRRLTVVMANPRDLRAIDELAFRSGYVIRPILVPELRLTYALQHYYRLPRKSRDMIPSDAVRAQLARLERGGQEAAAPIAAPSPRPAEPDLADLELDLAALAATSNGAGGASTALHNTPTAAASPAAQTTPAKPDTAASERPAAIGGTLQSTLRQLAAAGSHDDVATTLLHYLGARYARVALFKVAGGDVVAWDGIHRGMPIPGFREARLPLSDTSVLKGVVESLNPFRGALTANACDRPLLELLGPPSPIAGLLLPLAMRNRAVALIWLDDPQINPLKAQAEVEQLGVKVLLTFEMLILKKKILAT